MLDINDALSALDQDGIEFWKSIRSDKRCRFNLNPVDIIKLRKGVMVKINSNFADKVRRLIVEAIHIHVNGMKIKV